MPSPKDRRGVFSRGVFSLRTGDSRTEESLTSRDAPTHDAATPLVPPPAPGAAWADLLCVAALLLAVALAALPVQEAP